MPTVRTLNRTRADYYEAERKLYEALYDGGRKLEDLKKKILPKRPAETEEWYKLRIGVFHYLPRAAQIVDELSATVFQGDLQLVPAKPADDVERPRAPHFYEEFFGDPCGDRSGTIVDLFYQGFTAAQVQRDEFFLVTFPDVDAENRADQEKLGGLRARAVKVDAGEVLDIAEDADGIKWIKLFHVATDDDPLLADDLRKDTWRWTLIDRELIRTWELVVEHGKQPEQDLEVPEASSSQHRWADARRVPVVRLRLGDRLWLMDKIGSMLVAETRKRNALSWYEDLCCFPQPVHKGDETIAAKKQADPNGNQGRGAQFFYEIGPDDELEYLEPGGASLSHLKDRLESMSREIMQVVHQAASAIGPEAASQMQSAASKVRDSVAKRLLAAVYADDVKKAAATLLDLVSIARGDRDLRWEAQGLDQHDIADVTTATDEAVKIGTIEVPSETFRREFAKRFVRCVLSGAPVAIMEKIDQELEGAEFGSTLSLSPPGLQGQPGDQKIDPRTGRPVQNPPPKET